MTKCSLTSDLKSLHFLCFADSKLAADMKVDPAELPMDIDLPAGMQSPVDIFPAMIMRVSLAQILLTTKSAAHMRSLHFLFAMLIPFETVGFGAVDSSKINL